MIINYIKKFQKILLNLEKKYSWFELKTPKHSICNHELFYVFCFIEITKPSVVFESGIYRGRSTLIISETMKNYGNVISSNFKNKDEKNVEIFKFQQDYKNLQILNERGENLISKININCPFVALVDGPKPKSLAWEKLVNEICKNKNLLAFFQHDVCMINMKKNFEQQFNKFNNYKIIYCKDEIRKSFFDDSFKYNNNLGFYIKNNFYKNFKKSLCFSKFL